MVVRADEVEVQKDVLRIFSLQVLIILGCSHSPVLEYFKMDGIYIVLYYEG
jgi:hypothetical protein